MTDTIERFFAAWGEPDADTRAAQITAVLSDGAVYSDPRSGGRLKGPHAIADYVANFSANAPGWTAKAESISEVGGYFRARVAFGGMGPDGKTMTQHGTYFCEMAEDGKLGLLAGFVGSEA